jgi:hypothetical protein
LPVHETVNTAGQLHEFSAMRVMRVTVSPSAKIDVWRILVLSIPLVYDGNRFLRFRRIEIPEHGSGSELFFSLLNNNKQNSLKMKTK